MCWLLTMNRKSRPHFRPLSGWVFVTNCQLLQQCQELGGSLRDTQLPEAGSVWRVENRTSTDIPSGSLSVQWIRVLSMHSVCLSRSPSSFQIFTSLREADPQTFDTTSSMHLRDVLCRTIEDILTVFVLVRHNGPVTRMLTRYPDEVYTFKIIL